MYQYRGPEACLGAYVRGVIKIVTSMRITECVLYIMYVYVDTLRPIGGGPYGSVVLLQ